jgi:hypothetical protein
MYFFIVYSVLDIIPLSDVAAVEIRMKKEIAAQARIPEDSITEVTLERGIFTIIN